MSGMLSRRGLLGRETTLVGMTFGVDVDGPAFRGGVWIEVPTDDLDPVFSIVGVRPVSLKTSEIDRVRLLDISSSESSSNCGKGLCSRIPSSFETASNCWSTSDDDAGATRSRVSDGIKFGALAFGFGIDLLGIAPLG